MTSKFQDFLIELIATGLTAILIAVALVLLLPA